MAATVGKNNDPEDSKRVEKDRILKISVYHNMNLWVPYFVQVPLYSERDSRNRISEAGAGSA